MPAFFARARIGNTFYGQQMESSPASPIYEFDVVGVTEDFVTAARIPVGVTQIRTIHVFSRHTGCSSDGWAHVSWFRKPINHRRRKKIVAWAILLTILLGCVLFAV